MILNDLYKCVTEANEFPIIAVINGYDCYLTVNALSRLICRKVYKIGLKFRHNLQSSLVFNQFKLWNDIFDSLETMSFSAT